MSSKPQEPPLHLIIERFLNHLIQFSATQEFDILNYRRSSLLLSTIISYKNQNYIYCPTAETFRKILRQLGILATERYTPLSQKRKRDDDGAAGSDSMPTNRARSRSPTLSDDTDQPYSNEQVPLRPVPRSEYTTHTGYVHVESLAGPSQPSSVRIRNAGTHERHTPYSQARYPHRTAFQDSISIGSTDYKLVLSDTSGMQPSESSQGPITSSSTSPATQPRPSPPRATHPTPTPILEIRSSGPVRAVASEVPRSAPYPKQWPCRQTKQGASSANADGSTSVPVVHAPEPNQNGFSGSHAGSASSSTATRNPHIEESHDG